MCIPVDSMLWALVRRIRDEGYVATDADLRALRGSGCSAERARQVLGSEGEKSPGKPFDEALRALARVG
ncbi:MAG TPA: hypothetical protein VIF09_13220 [Polyangiaceae bacterium]|jgi:hypothetical protein